MLPVGFKDRLDEVLLQCPIRDVSLCNTARFRLKQTGAGPPGTAPISTNSLYRHSSLKDG